MDVVVFGAGSLGSLVGGLLAQEHEVTLVGRDPHVAAVAADGLTVEGEFDFSVTPDATTDGSGLRADLAVLTVKAYDTAEAAGTLATGEYGAALSLQNGMGNEATLDERLDCPVLAGTATYGAVLRDPGRVECTGVGEIALGPYEGGDSAAAARVARAFRRADLTVAVADDMPRRLWEKLAVNAGINAVTALSRVENGAVLSGPANDLARTAARETARVARVADVTLSNRAAVAAVEDVAAGTADNDSSMLQDVRGGRRTEVDAINGYVTDRAAEFDLDTPVNRTLIALLRAWERGRGLR
ncbi:ketopantoate reductase family protein [Halostella sp. JP-L12]|uniref:ketopantoate reductase family protein n=1 Tax=Halostella TaxID=1843185 RepID=UPI000EF7FEFA|nr:MULTISPECIES: ketopantoate reductase family protein [Halostella]NHN46138.1 ketopantoate reductase family protein [Halostella sp. JP-L12]